jgi:hypothetical protein
LPRVVSLDIHKATCTYVVREWDQLLAGPKRIPTTRPALTNLAKAYPGAEFVFEATAVSEWVHDVFVEAGARAVVYKPFHHGGRKGKGDHKDADRGAKRRIAGELKEVYVPPMEFRVLREKIRSRCFLVGLKPDSGTESMGISTGRTPLENECQVTFRASAPSRSTVELWSKDASPKWLRGTTSSIPSTRRFVQQTRISRPSRKVSVR